VLHQGTIELAASEDQLFILTVFSGSGKTKWRTYNGEIGGEQT